MSFLLEYLKFRIIVIPILVSIFFSVYGLECYHCSASIGLTGNGPLQFDKIKLAHPPPGVHHGCEKLERYRNPPKVTCALNEPTCGASLMLFNYTYRWGPDLINEQYKVIIRNCTDTPLPKKGERCIPASEVADRVWLPRELPLPRNASTIERGVGINDNETFTGVMCLCGTDNCNEQPGFENFDEDYVRSTTTTRQHHEDESQRNLVQNYLLSSAMALWFFSFYYFSI